VKAAPYFERLLEGARQLAAHDPDNARWRRLVGVGAIKVAKIHLFSGRPAQAVPLLRECLELDQASAAERPQSSEAQRDLWLDHQFLAQALARLGKSAEAEAERKLGLECLRQAARLAPDDAKIRQELKEYEGRN
jgi:tetratricopeptide (TPR) repeat protein